MQPPPVRHEPRDPAIPGVTPLADGRIRGGGPTLPGARLPRHHVVVPKVVGQVDEVDDGVLRQKKPIYLDVTCLPEEGARVGVHRMGKALHSTSRDIVYSQFLLQQSKNRTQTGMTGMCAWRADCFCSTLELAVPQHSRLHMR